METEYLVYFKKIAETENMSKAARLLCISQPALSRILKKLEDEFGTPLFVRNGKNLKLNTSGRTLLNYANQILPLLNQAYSDIHSLSDQSQKLLLNMLYCNCIFPSMLADFSSLHPNIQINITRYENDNKIAVESDVVVHASDAFAQTHESWKLFDEPCLIGLSSAHPLAAKSYLSLNDLKHEKFVTLPRDNSLGALTYDFFNKYALSPQITMECDNQYSLASFVSLGSGIGLFPSLTYQPENGSIVYRPIEDITISRSVYLSSANSHISKSTAIFIKFAIAYIESFLSAVS